MVGAWDFHGWLKVKSAVALPVIRKSFWNFAKQTKVCLILWHKIRRNKSTRFAIDITFVRFLFHINIDKKNTFTFSRIAFFPQLTHIYFLWASNKNKTLQLAGWLTGKLTNKHIIPLEGEKCTLLSPWKICYVTHILLIICCFLQILLLFTHIKWNCLNFILSLTLHHHLDRR